MKESSCEKSHRASESSYRFLVHIDEYIAFLLTAFLLVTLGVLQRVITLSRESWGYSDLWLYLGLFFFVGFAIAWRRYQ